MTDATIQTRYLLAFLRGVEETCRKHNDVGGLQVVEAVRWFVDDEQSRAEAGKAREPAIVSQSASNLSLCSAAVGEISR